MSDYPECEKLAEVADESNKIGQFLEWLREEGFDIGEYNDADNQLYPISMRIEKLLSHYFNIDMKKVEAERQEMLNAIQSDEGEVRK